MSDEVLFFSIVIPAYNEENYIGKTLSALKELDYPPDRVEVIIVDNGSTDQTESVVAETRLCPGKSSGLKSQGFHAQRTGA